MNNLDRDLRVPGIRPDAPYVDAAAYLADRIGEAEAAAKATDDDVVAARAACDAIKKIAAIDLTPAVCAQIAAVLAGRVGRSSWSHFSGVEDVLAQLDGAVDGLGAV